MQRHRHQEFIRFLNAIEREVPKGKAIHVILDNYAVHKHAKFSRLLKNSEMALRAPCRSNGKGANSIL
jgi:transposase